MIKTPGCSAVGSAPALGAGCRRFESCHSDQRAPRLVRGALWSSFQFEPAEFCGVRRKTPGVSPFTPVLLFKEQRRDAAGSEPFRASVESCHSDQRAPRLVRGALWSSFQFEPAEFCGVRRKTLGVSPFTPALLFKEQRRDAQVASPLGRASNPVIPTKEPHALRVGLSFETWANTITESVARLTQNLYPRYNLQHHPK